MKKTISFLFAFLFIVSVHLSAKNKTEDIRLYVLKHGQLGKEYKFDTEDSTRTYLRSLGTIRTKNGKTYKILTSVWIWGMSHRATSRVLIYTNKNKSVGNYYLSTADDVPHSIKNNKLVFLNNAPDCDPKLITYIDLSNGIPKEFFRKCKGNYGDIYTFSND